MGWFLRFSYFNINNLLKFEEYLSKDFEAKKATLSDINT